VLPCAHQCPDAVTGDVAETSIEKGWLASHALREDEDGSFARARVWLSTYGLITVPIHAPLQHRGSASGLSTPASHA